MLLRTSTLLNVRNAASSDRKRSPSPQPTFTYTYRGLGIQPTEGIQQTKKKQGKPRHTHDEMGPQNGHVTTRDDKKIPRHATPSKENRIEIFARILKKKQVPRTKIRKSKKEKAAKLPSTQQKKKRKNGKKTKSTWSQYVSGK